MRLKRIAPWRREENDHKMIGWMATCFQKFLVTAVNEFDRRVEVRDIPARQIEHIGFDLKTDAPGTWQVAQDGVKAVARACKWIDDPDSSIADRWTQDRCN